MLKHKVQCEVSFWKKADYSEGDCSGYIALFHEPSMDVLGICFGELELKKVKILFILWLLCTRDVTIPDI